MEKAIALLSGGIDSPVAIALLQSHYEIIAVHAHQQPLSPESELEKVRALARHLYIKKTYLVPFVDILNEYVKHCRHEYYFVLSKIAFMILASEVAKKEGAKLIVTGENLAQVSSQTLQNLFVISSCSPLPILRPVLTYDKDEIVNKAIEIGTYSLSKGPELCHLLGPKNPATRTSLEKTKLELKKIPLLYLVQESLNKAQIFLT